MRVPSPDKRRGLTKETIMKSLFVLFTGLIVAVERFSPILSDALSALCTSMQKEWDDLMSDLSVAKEQMKDYRKLYNDECQGDKVEQRLKDETEDYNKRLRDEIRDYSNLVDDERTIWEVIIPYTWISKHMLSAVRILRDTFKVMEQSALGIKDAKHIVELRINTQGNLFISRLSTKEMLVVVHNLNQDEFKRATGKDIWDGVQIKMTRN
jgi:hypothetical protein